MGLSKRQILNTTSSDHKQLNAKFTNIACLLPIKVKNLQTQHKNDLLALKDLQ